MQSDVSPTEGSSAGALFTPVRIGAWSLSHRVVMAPLTRLRSRQPGNVPHALNATYYAQRASAGGLIVGEATQVCPQGQGYPHSPGIHTREQAQGWRLVTDAVHARGGLIVCQLWHVGRISHPSFQPAGALPVAPSAIRPEGQAFTAAWERVPFETPRALEAGEIPGVVEAFRRGAELAREAGFDGVEIHGANGYLLDQFLRRAANRREDAYGGPIEHRVRFPLEVARAVAGVWGGERVGIRLSPFGSFNDMHDDDPLPLYRRLLGGLSELGLAYAHLIEPRQDEEDSAKRTDLGGRTVGAVFRGAFAGAIIAAGGYDGPEAARTVARGDADAVAFGRAFIANPDLPERLRRGAELNAWDRSTFYGGAERGYTDYPALGA